VCVFDYGFGNVRSAMRALEHVGARVELTRDRAIAESAAGLVVPGVGAFEAVMRGLVEARGDQIIGRRLAGSRPVLGICVGMQVMFERGVEHGIESRGLSQWPGTVELLQTDVVPNMGWAHVEAPAGTRLVVRVTNKETGAYYDADSSGVALIDEYADGAQSWHILGPVLLGVGEGNLPRGMWLVDGAYKLHWSADRVKTVTGAVLSKTDVCAQID